VRLVDVAGHGNVDIKIKTLASMIRQTGLPKSLFTR
jgi:predicted RNA binding protein YcfA (HicA-like mRNA interferase family)